MEVRRGLLPTFGRLTTNAKIWDAFKGRSWFYQDQRRDLLGTYFLIRPVQGNIVTCARRTQFCANKKKKKITVASMQINFVVYISLSVVLLVTVVIYHLQLFSLHGVCSCSSHVFGIVMLCSQVLVFVVVVVYQVIRNLYNEYITVWSCNVIICKASYDLFCLFSFIGLLEQNPKVIPKFMDLKAEAPSAVLSLVYLHLLMVN